MSRTLTLDDPASAAEAAERVVAALRRGDLVVLPTDSVYAVVADAFSTTATQRLFAAKRRGREVPLTVLLRNPRQVIGLAADVPETAERLMASYWPGPVTVVLPAQPDLPWDLGEARDTVALRMPADDFILDVVAEVGPLACSGANRRGESPATDVAEAELQLGDAIALYVDGGHRPFPTSTIVDCSREGADVLREAAVPTEHVRRVATGEVSWGQRPDEVPTVTEPTPAPIDDEPGDA